ncbi:hypothetical protein DOTSEDRAFT_74505 [Dothistroma septosporum NZE10]|uniref:Uncharacterized protein n=1 Tax=Dothistroma septosporum (strain NZE10 / CBS 128990) TaxID=675120 RepID=N1PEC0_DOTSN|nr:hypothetical protein DOTSEDRAFT_74505 [Dothistroma septosporum NZE10]
MLFLVSSSHSSRMLYARSRRPYECTPAACAIDSSISAGPRAAHSSASAAWQAVRKVATPAHWSTVNRSAALTGVKQASLRFRLEWLASCHEDLPRSSTSCALEPFSLEGLAPAGAPLWRRSVKPNGASIRMSHR